MLPWARTLVARMQVAHRNQLTLYLTASHNSYLTGVPLYRVVLLLLWSCRCLQLPDCTPLPPPLALRTAPQPATMPSPRGAAAPAQLDLAAEIQRKQQQQLTGNSPQQTQACQQQQQPQQQRRARVGEARPPITITAVYPNVMPGMPNPNSPTAQQRAQQQQAWANTPGGMPGKGLVRAPCTRI